MILHIIESENWNKVKNEEVYAPSSLDDEGFIHCSTKEQVLGVANFLFKGQPNLLLLCIDPNKVNARIVYEDLYETGKLFPHIYGPLNIDAVSKVVAFKPTDDGSFQLPEELNHIVSSDS
jgi:uncharacterized protein (DUF952 family)